MITRSVRIASETSTLTRTKNLSVFHTLRPLILVIGNTDTLTMTQEGVNHSSAKVSNNVWQY